MITIVTMHTIGATLIVSGTILVTGLCMIRRFGNRPVSQNVVYHCKDDGRGLGSFSLEKNYQFSLRQREKDLERKYQQTKGRQVGAVGYDAELALSLVRPSHQSVVKMDIYLEQLICFAERGVLLVPVDFMIDEVGSDKIKVFQERLSC